MPSAGANRSEIDMNIRHETPRNPPESQRPPHGNGWSRRRSNFCGGATVWLLWAAAFGKRIIHASVTVTDIEIALSGRREAAINLLEARRTLRQAVAAGKIAPKDHVH